MLLSSHTCHFCEITTISFNLPLWSVLLDVSYKASDLGDHILNTVSSINLSQREKALKLTFLSKRNICVQIGLSFCETTFMILLLVLSHHPLSSSVEKKG